MVEPPDIPAVSKVFHLCKKEGVPCYMVGNGSNLLVSDAGYRGVIISTGRLDTLWLTDGQVTAGAGVLLSKLASESCKAGLSGLEFAAGIPGSVGGAVVMNAGAYGSEMKEVLRSATVLAEDGTVLELSNGELELGYRTSCIIRRGYVVLEAVFALPEGRTEEIRGRMEELAAKRKEKQPLEYPSAGSTFKRPEGYFAGKLIEDAGLKGFRLGGAAVSEKHAGFVINKENASADDIWRLCQYVRQKVEEQSGVTLEPEVKVLGVF